ncbi:hypothetical protein [Methylobacterium sp. E-066]|nr:hypothetical protein [Methylobacterium sp. E-066]
MTILDEQTDAMVAALREVADHAKTATATPAKATAIHHKVA